MGRSYSPVECYQRFGGIYCLHVQGGRGKINVLSYPENGGMWFLQNVGNDKWDYLQGDSSRPFGIIIPSMSRFSKWIFLSDSPFKVLYVTIFPTAQMRPTCPSHPPWCDHLNIRLIEKLRSWYEHCETRAGIAQLVWWLATGWTAETSEFVSRWGENSLFFTSSRPALGLNHPLIYLEPGSLSPGIKWPVREVDHSRPNSAEVKKTWIYTSTPSYIFMA
jgi:hypothetical protein